MSVVRVTRACGESGLMAILLASRCTALALSRGKGVYLVSQTRAPGQDVNCDYDFVSDFDFILSL